MLEQMAGVDSLLPPPVRAALNARRAGPPEEAILTGRNVPLPTFGSDPTQVPLWLVRCPDSLWLVGALDEPAPHGLATDVAVGVYQPGAVRVETHWRNASVVIDSVRAVLRPSTVDSVRALLQRFRPTGRRQAPHRLDARLAHQQKHDWTTPAATLPGAEVADFWLRSGGGPSDEPWLSAVQTATSTVLMGHVRDVPRRVWIGVSEHRIGLVLDPTIGQGRDRLDLLRPLQLRTHQGRPVLFDRSLTLLGGFKQHSEFLLIHRLSRVSGGYRFAILALEHFHAGRFPAALAMLKGGLDRGHEAALAEPLATLAAACGRPLQAVTHLKRAIDSFGEQTDFAAFRNGVARLAHACTETKVTQQLPVTEALTLLDRSEVPMPKPLEGAPWPPASPAEIWATAASQSRLTSDIAIHPLSGETDPLRILQWTAAITQQPTDHRRAARALRQHGRHQEAQKALLRALTPAPSLEDVWLRASWAALDDDVEELHAALIQALAIDPEAQSAPVYLHESALASVAAYADQQRLSAAPALMDLADRTVGQAPVAFRIGQARRVRDLHSHPTRAARMLNRIADHLGEQATTDRSGAAVRLEAAEAFLTAGLHSAALSAVRKAVSEDFLRAETYRNAADMDGLPATPTERQWWRHLANVLDSQGEPPSAGLSPLATLTSNELHNLYPGEGHGAAGWWTRIGAPALPPRDQLIRGLERVDASTSPRVFQLVDRLCASLGIDPVPTYIYRGDDALGVSGWPTQPPVILVGGDHLGQSARSLSEPELRYALAVELSHLAAGHPVLAFDDSLLGTSRSVYQAFGKFAGTAETAVDLVSLIPGIDQLAKLQRLIKLSRQVFFVQKAVNKAQSLAQPLLRRLFPEAQGPRQRGVTRDGLRGAALAFRVQADRAALRLTGDMHSAVRAILATSAHPVHRLDALHQQGLGSLMNAPNSVVGADEAIRIAALFEDAARSGPPNAAGDT